MFKFILRWVKLYCGPEWPLYLPSNSVYSRNNFSSTYLRCSCHSKCIFLPCCGILPQNTVHVDCHSTNSNAARGLQGRVIAIDYKLRIAKYYRPEKLYSQPPSCGRHPVIIILREGSLNIWHSGEEVIRRLGSEGTTLPGENWICFELGILVTRRLVYRRAFDSEGVGRLNGRLDGLKNKWRNGLIRLRCRETRPWKLHVTRRTCSAFVTCTCH